MSEEPIIFLDDKTKKVKQYSKSTNIRHYKENNGLANKIKKTSYQYDHYNIKMLTTNKQAYDAEVRKNYINDKILEQLGGPIKDHIELARKYGFNEDTKKEYEKRLDLALAKKDISYEKIAHYDGVGLPAPRLGKEIRELKRRKKDELKEDD